MGYWDRFRCGQFDRMRWKFRRQQQHRRNCVHMFARYPEGPDQLRRVDVAVEPHDMPNGPGLQRSRIEFGLWQRLRERHRESRLSQWAKFGNETKALRPIRSNGALRVAHCYRGQRRLLSTRPAVLNRASLRALMVSAAYTTPCETGLGAQQTRVPRAVTPKKNLCPGSESNQPHVDFQGKSRVRGMTKRR